MQKLQKSKKSITRGKHYCRKPSQVVITGSKPCSMRTKFYQQIAALQRLYVNLVNEDKKNDINIIAKSHESAEYSYISICLKHGYKIHKTQVLLARNQCSILFTQEDTPNAIVMFNFWQKQRIIVVNPNRPRHFRLNTINRDQLLVWNNV